MRNRGENAQHTIGLDRREFIAISGAALAFGFHGPVSAQSTPPADYAEAPSLAALVEEGSLPPVADRLPTNPLVVEPVENIGEYGGEWNMGLLGGLDTAWIFRTIGYEYLVRWNPEGTEVLPNVAESFEASEDAMSFTITLRQGLKWSDGEPFTTDDIMFYVEDILNNEDLTLSMGANPPSARQLDEYTVELSFAEPNGLFIQTLASPESDVWTRFPKHYLSQFHPTYNTTNLDALVEEAGAEDWVELFRTKGHGIPGTPYDARWQNAELPTMNGWRIVEPYGTGSTIVAAERNPYYFKVDTAGNQLPYVDRVVYTIVEDHQVMILKAMAGEIDMQDRNITDLQSKPVLADAREDGDYRFYDLVDPGENSDIIQLNLNAKDAVKREIFQNLDFRIGLSHAINRQEMIDLFYVGQGEPWQPAPLRDTPFFNERLAKQYTEYDLDLANEHLDRAFSDKDGDGYRLGPDGNRITFLLETTTDKRPERGDLTNYLAEGWKQVGVEALVQIEDRSLLYSRMGANEHEAVIGNGVSGIGPAVIIDPRYYLPQNNESRFAPAWTVWYNPNAGIETAPEEPPAEVQEQMRIYDAIMETTDEEQQIELMRQVLEIAADQFYVMGVSLPVTGYGVVKNNFRNVPEVMANTWTAPHPAIYNTCQFYFTS